MRALFVMGVMSLLLFPSCATRGGGGNSAASTEQLSADVAELKRQVADLQKLQPAIEALRVEVAERFKSLGQPGSGPAASDGMSEEEKGMRELAAKIAETSDAVRLWAGVVNNAQYTLYPMTKGEEVDSLNEQLGGKYVYLLVRIANNSTAIWDFQPKKGQVSAQMSESGDTPNVLCRDPMELIEGQERIVGGKLSYLRNYFGPRTLKPKEVMYTHIIFEEGVDFAKVKKLYWGDFVILEVTLPSPK